MTKQVLIVDDDERIREVVHACLEDLAGWTVLGAGSGQTALVQAKTQPIDAILLDLSMPDMDGLTILQKLKADPQTQHIPVILLTAKTLGSEQAQVAAMGVAGVIAKPFNALEITSQIATLLGWDESAVL